MADDVFRDPNKTKKFSKGFREQTFGEESEKERTEEEKAKEFMQGTPEEGWKRAQDKLSEILLKNQLNPVPPPTRDPVKEYEMRKKALDLMMTNPQAIQQQPLVPAPQLSPEEEKMNQLRALAQKLGRKVEVPD